KNTSALLYSYVTASRGEVGVDLKSIMPDAIQSVEVLRDGAAAQYGSDAIAGVLNLVLKDKIAPFANVGYSTTHKGDGTQYQASTGFSLDLLKKGFATFTLGYYQQQRSQRAGKITSVANEAEHWGTSTYSLNDFQAYLGRNPSAGFQVGLPDLQVINLSLNAGYDLGTKNKTKLYLFGTLMDRRGKSPQFARGPYWVQGFEAIYPNQDFFLPEMAPKIIDHTLSLGLRHSIEDWKMDFSTTFGNNKIDYFIENSFNQSLGANSPQNFYNGTHSFKHLVNNIDITKTFYFNKTPSITLAFGAEQRLEAFRTIAGEFASYGDGTPGEADRVGSESFSGLHPKDALRGTRNNIGFYTELTGDVSSRLQIGIATRFEHYSDFGGNLSWKGNARYKLIPKKLNLRASISNGFRAPALHQIYYASTTTTLTPTGIVQNRILNNLDPALSILDIPKLMPETSFNLGTGFSYKFSDKIVFSTDVYKIDVKDRIVLSGQIGKQGLTNSPINQLLKSSDTESAGFFLNAVNTTTKGIDLILNIDHILLGQGSLQSTIAANFSQTIVQAVHLPAFIEGNDLRDEVFSREDIARLETWRPRQKIMFTSTYSKGPLSSTIAVNYFGAVTYKHPNDPADDATYTAKTLTDWSIAYSFKSNIKWQIGVQNLFNVYPDTFLKAYDGMPNDRNIDFVGRFKYPWQTMQIGIDGIRGFTKLNVTF
ncbi:MAG: TonB-dependent receptor plug domain-containing protein, partial [Saprospiraceae bacterium]